MLISSAGGDVLAPQDPAGGDGHTERRAAANAAPAIATPRAGHVAADDGERDWARLEAARLLNAERLRRPAPLLSARRPSLTLRDAYRVQRHAAALRTQAGGRIAGFKVGLTSAAMQRQAGIDEPDSGILFDTMAIEPGQSLPSGELMAPRVEAEIAFRIGDNLAGAEVTDEMAWRSVAEVCLALEVIDSRFDEARITLADSVADNASSGRFVLGQSVPSPTWTLCDEQLTVCVDRAPCAVGYGRDVLGDPIRSVVWLARHLATMDAGLRAGDVVLAGAVHASIPLRADTEVSVSSPHLPPVRLHVT